MYKVHLRRGIGSELNMDMLKSESLNLDLLAYS